MRQFFLGWTPIFHIESWLCNHYGHVGNMVVKMQGWCYQYHSLCVGSTLGTPNMIMLL